MADDAQQRGVVHRHHDIVHADRDVVLLLAWARNRGEHDGPGTPGHNVARRRRGQVSRGEQHGVSRARLERAGTRDFPAREGIRKPEC